MSCPLQVPGACAFDMTQRGGFLQHKIIAITIPIAPSHKHCPPSPRSPEEVIPSQLHSVANLGSLVCCLRLTFGCVCSTLMTFATVGYGDIYAKTLVEELVADGMMILGVLSFGFIIGASQ